MVNHLKAREVPIESHHHARILDGDRGEDRIRHEISQGVGVVAAGAENVEVT